MAAHEMSAAPSSAGAPRPDEADPRRLSLAGVSPDGTLLLTDDDGDAFTLVVDARVRAAVPDRKEPPMQTQPESALRPRDIQARIRSGESPEQVAAAAQTTVEKVMPFAGPVLAEREHIAERAQRSSVRRPAGSTSAESGARTLGDVVQARLRGLDIDPSGVVTWDSWRREDGRWTLTGDYEVSARLSSRTGSATFIFDLPGNFVTLDDDDALWLVGELAEPEPVPEPVTVPGVRRLAAVHDRSAVRADAYDADEGAAQLSIDDALAHDDEQTGAPALSRAAGVLTPEADPDHDADHDAGHDAAAPARRPVRKTRGRASVPSWDEIMFGPSD